MKFRRTKVYRIAFRNLKDNGVFMKTTSPTSPMVKSGRTGYIAQGFSGTAKDKTTIATTNIGGNVSTVVLKVNKDWGITA